MPALSVLFAAFFSSYSAAVECYSESPTVIAGGNVFDYQAAQPLSGSERKHLQAFLKKIDRDWQGSASRIVCVGSEANARQVIRNTELALEIEGDHRREMTFRAEVYDPQRRASYNEGFRLYQSDSFLRMDSRGPDGNIEVMNITANELVFLQRYFVRKPKPPEPEKPEDKPAILPIFPDMIENLLPSIQPVDEVTTLPVEEKKRKKREKSDREDDSEPEVEYSPGGVLNEVVRHISLKGRTLEIDITVYANGYLASSEKWQLR
ncbi:hypothetical protein [uncultured Endozoicomonas sp.]|uniref:hypothetical protein n=1 Tax=uncultured Endozoicomonas sp. TaxID=432652 RepID=UPI00261D8785|nr:hypothetical protein [uncultured Endozoicomonas sp.]